VATPFTVETNALGQIFGRMNQACGATPGTLTTREHCHDPEVLEERGDSQMVSDNDLLGNPDLLVPDFDIRNPANKPTTSPLARRWSVTGGSHVQP
jgi:hypothetical protein